MYYCLTSLATTLCTAARHKQAPKTTLCKYTKYIYLTTKHVRPSPHTEAATHFIPLQPHSARSRPLWLVHQARTVTVRTKKNRCGRRESPSAQNIHPPRLDANDWIETTRMGEVRTNPRCPHISVRLRFAWASHEVPTWAKAASGEGT